MVRFYSSPHRLVVAVLMVLEVIVKESLMKSQNGAPIEFYGPSQFIALGGMPLVYKYRILSHIPELSEENGAEIEENSTKISSSPGVTHPKLCPFIQLTFSNEEDGTEGLIVTKELPHLPSSRWNEISFECGLIVRAGIYHIRFLEDERSADFTLLSFNGHKLEGSIIEFYTAYPTIDFEVPHYLETYSTSVLISFGLTKSLCKAIYPLPPTLLLLSRDSFNQLENMKSSSAILLENPLLRLQEEGKVSVAVDCHLWSRNTSYNVEIRENFNTKRIIAKSRGIKVEWSSKFSLSFRERESIIPCRGIFRLYVTYPPCANPERDKVRVYGYESQSVPSFFSPMKKSYITEKQILRNRTDGRVVSFSCSLFPQRFSHYCFEYVNLAEDESVAIVLEKCIPTLSLNKLLDGGWGPWSAWSECSESCGSEGKKFRYRFCDSPQPTFGSNFCQGNSIEESPCSSSSEVDGNTYPTCPPFQNDKKELMNKNRVESTAPPHKNYELTKGCECGCILHNLVPLQNYSLIISLSSNHSSCEDEDEEEHHNLKWILHTQDERDRLEVRIIDATVECVTMSFRDGNTTDSNLLQVISTTLTQPLNNNKSYEETLSSGGEKIIISSHDSLLIVASDSLNILSSHNCSQPSIYLLALYHVIPHQPDIQLFEETLLHWSLYDFWVILAVKLILLLFLLIALLSLFSGCASKVYRYKKLSWSKHDEIDPNFEPTPSQSTSVTQLSFDYAYWRELKIQRLKEFLLRPRKRFSTASKSHPSSPKPTTQLIKRRVKSEKMIGKEMSVNKVAQFPQKMVKNSTKSLSEEESINNHVKSSERGSSCGCNSLNDFELDYYDYDILNAGNIPGSYLLEPSSYTFWADSVIYDDQLMMSSSLTTNTDPIGTNEFELLNTSTSFGTSILFTPTPEPLPKDCTISETSFHSPTKELVEPTKITIEELTKN